MNDGVSSPVLERLLDPLTRCLTKESARKLLELRAEPQLQSLVDKLAEKCNEGTLSSNEQADYANFVAFGTFVALLKSKARQLLAESAEE